MDKVLFVHIPKTGGTSISQWLGGPTSGHPKIETLLEKTKGNPVTFTVVRNPWDRAVSAYTYLFKTSKVSGFQQYIDKGTPSFDDFIKGLETVKVDHMWFNGATPQVEWIRPGVDIVLKFENLREDFKIIQKITGDFRPLPHLNGSRHGHYSEYFTPETRDIIAKIFHEDIERFGYEFSSSS
jgi:chondroitin 4-sulfotransferase 11